MRLASSSPATPARFHADAHRCRFVGCDRDAVGQREGHGVLVCGLEPELDRIVAVVAEHQLVTAAAPRAEEAPTDAWGTERDADGAGVPRPPLVALQHFGGRDLDRVVSARGRFLGEVLQQDGELRRGLGTVGRALGHTPPDDLRDRRRQGGQRLCRRLLTVLPQELKRLALEGRAAGQHVIEGDPQRVDVGAMVRAPARGLGRGVERRAHE